MHIRVCWDVKSRLMTARAGSLFVIFLLLAGTAGLGYLFRNHDSFAVPAAIVGGGLLAVLVWWGISRVFLRHYEHAQVDTLDAAFERIYLRDFTLGQRDDLTARWTTIREQTTQTLKNMGLRSIPARSPRSSRQYRRLQRMLSRNITRLRD